MEYIESVFNQMLISGITIPAMMLGYYITFRSFSNVILPLAIYGVIDHILVRLLYIIEIQQGTFSQFGTKITQIDWLGVMITNAWQDVLAFFIISFVVFSLCKLVKKIKR